MEAQTQPQLRRGQLLVESHPVIVRNASSFSKKILLDTSNIFQELHGIVNAALTLPPEIELIGGIVKPRE